MGKDLPMVKLFINRGISEGVSIPVGLVGCGSLTGGNGGALTGLHLKGT